MRRIALLLAAALLATPAAGQAQDKPAGPTITPYGFVMLHTFFEDATFENKDNAYKVIAKTAYDSTGAYQFSVRGSRLGFKVGNLDTGFVGAAGSAVLEYDVQGGYTGTATTGRWGSALMRLRLANLKLDWSNGLQLEAGQDFGLVGPVFANSLTWGTDPIFVRSGKIYRRTPQARVTYNQAFDAVTLNVAAAVLANSESENLTAQNGAADFGPGNRSRVPDLEGRVMLTVKPNADFYGTVNASYHTHTRRYTTATVTKDITASIVNVGLDATLTKYAQVKGEYYTNEGAEDSYAGLLAGVVKPTATDPNTYRAAKSTGYWAQLTLKPIPEIWVTGGMGSAAADSSTKALLAAGTWYKNAQTHAGVIFNASKNLTFSAEVAMVESSYLNATTQKGNEYSVSTKMAF